jgi:hypothetical protein
MNNIAWVSVDPAKGKSGVAQWEGSTLIRVETLKPRGNAGKFYLGDATLGSLHEAWIAALLGADKGAPVVMEKGAGGRANIVNAQGWIRGYIARGCVFAGLVPVELDVSEWRRIIKEQCGVSWPADRDRKKALSIQLVKQLYGLDVSDDEADAVLIGRAALACGLVELKSE